MESELLDANISVGSVNGNMPHVTPAVLIYCEKLMEYIANKSPTFIMSIVAVTALQGKLLWDLTGPGADVRAILRKAIAVAIRDEIAKWENIAVTSNMEPIGAYGLGMMYDALGNLFNSGAMDAFMKESLNFAIYDCIDVMTVDSHQLFSSETSFVASLGAERLKIPSNINLINGMLVSEMCVGGNNPINNCVCIDGVPLWPVADATIKLSTNEQAHDGTYRLQAKIWDGLYFGGLDYSDVDHAFIVFTDPSFLQGVQTMDRILGAQTPSWSNLQIYQGGQWRNTVVVQS